MSMTKKEVRIIAQQFAEVIKKRWKKPLHRYDLVKSKDGVRVKDYTTPLRKGEKILGQVDILSKESKIKKVN